MVMAQLEPNTMDCSLIIGIKEPVFVSIESNSIDAVVALRAAAFNSSTLGNSSRTTLTPGQDAVLRCDVRVFFINREISPSFVSTLGRTGGGAAVRVAFKLLALGRAKPKRGILLALHRAGGGWDVALLVPQVLPTLWVCFTSTRGRFAFLRALFVVAVFVLIFELLAFGQSFSPPEGLSTVGWTSFSNNSRRLRSRRPRSSPGCCWSWCLPGGCWLRP